MSIHIYINVGHQMHQYPNALKRSDTSSWVVSPNPVWDTPILHFNALPLY